MTPQAGHLNNPCEEAAWQRKQVFIQRRPLRSKSFSALIDWSAAFLIILTIRNQSIHSLHIMHGRFPEPTTWERKLYRYTSDKICAKNFLRISRCKFNEVCWSGLFSMAAFARSGALFYQNGRVFLTLWRVQLVLYQSGLLGIASICRQNRAQVCDFVRFFWLWDSFWVPLSSWTPLSFCPS